jgi:tetratricopeptide (TPR) repeat protein
MMTLAFLQSRAAAELEDARVLIVGTYRTEQVDDSLRRFASARPDRLVMLDRLEIESIRSMAKDMLASEMAPEGLIEFLSRHSEGNPFFAAEYLRAIIGRGLLTRDSDRRWQAPALAPFNLRESIELPVPDSLNGLFEMRTEGLSHPAASLLELACTLGREFELEVIEAFDRAMDQTLVGSEAMAIEELVARQIIEETESRRYRFVHDKLREASQQRIPQARRRTLHAAAARRLEVVQMGTIDPDRYDAQLGIHWAHAGEPARAFPCLRRSARRAEHVHANGEAAELYRLAIAQGDLTTIVDAPTGSDLRELHESLADLLVRIARHREARGYYDSAIAVTEEPDSLRHARLWRKKAQSYWTVHHYDEARQALGNAVTRIGPPDALRMLEQYGEWIEIQLGRFWCEYFARRTGPVTESIIGEMAGVVDHYGTALQRSAYYVCAALDILGRRRYGFAPEAVGHTRKALEVVSDDPAHAAEAAHARFNLAFALLLGERPSCEEAALHLKQTVADAERIGDATVLARALTYLAIAQRRLAAVEEAEATAQRAMRAAEDAQLSPYAGASAACLAWVSWKRGHAKEAHSLILEARRWWDKGDHAFPFKWLANFLLLDLHVAGDQLEAARAILGDLLDEKQQIFPPWLDAALRAASSLPSSTPDSTLSITCRRALALAEEHGYL